jgi:hypothetical protein
VKRAAWQRAWAAFGLALAAASAGCHELKVYAFEGQKYDPTDDCLLPKSVIDVVEGEPTPSSCTGVRCFVGGDGSLYVSSQCVAPPGYENVTNDASNATCQAALTSYDRGTDGACPTT